MAFVKYLYAGDRARRTHVFNKGFRGDGEVESFVQRFELKKRCDSVAELAKNVYVGFVQGCNWNEYLKDAKEFINARLSRYDLI